MKTSPVGPQGLPRSLSFPASYSLFTPSSQVLLTLPHHDSACPRARPSAPTQHRGPARLTTPSFFQHGPLKSQRLLHVLRWLPERRPLRRPLAAQSRRFTYITHRLLPTRPKGFALHPGPRPRGLDSPSTSPFAQPAGTHHGVPHCLHPPISQLTEPPSTRCSAQQLWGPPWVLPPRVLFIHGLLSAPPSKYSPVWPLLPQATYRSGQATTTSPGAFHHAWGSPPSSQQQSL